MRRRNNGLPLRYAMAEAGLTITRLAAATRDVDPEGAGISPAAVGFLLSAGKSARETTSPRAAQLIATALNTPIDVLFCEPFSVVTDSTSTPRGEMQTAQSTTGPEPLMTSDELRRYLRKSESWLDTEIRAGRIKPIYVGRSRRFDRLQVLNELAATAAA